MCLRKVCLQYNTIVQVKRSVFWVQLCLHLEKQSAEYMYFWQGESNEKHNWITCICISIRMHKQYSSLMCQGFSLQLPELPQKSTYTTNFAGVFLDFFNDCVVVIMYRYMYVPWFTFLFVIHVSVCTAYTSPSEDYFLVLDLESDGASVDPPHSEFIALPLLGTFYRCTCELALNNARSTSSLPHHHLCTFVGLSHTFLHRTVNGDELIWSMSFIFNVYFNGKWKCGKSFNTVFYIRTCTCM